MKNYLFKVILVLIIMTTYGNLVFAATFSDLTTEHWAYDNIINLVSNGVINGYEDGTYRPENPVTRGEFFKLIVSAMKDEMFENNYKMYAPIYVHWAGVYNEFLETKKYLVDDANKQTLNDNITRFEMAVMLGKIALGEQYPSLRIDENEESYDTELSDLEEIKDKDRRLIYVAVNKGFLNGYEDGTFRPSKNMTRAEVAAVISRILVSRLSQNL